MHPAKILLSWLLRTAMLLTAAAPAPASASNSCGAVKATHLAVDGRLDCPLGLDNTRPTLSWQMIQSTECSEDICPGDWQTAYRIQVASSTSRLRAGDLLWDSGKVESQEQQVNFQGKLVSRDTIAWRVRVWDAQNAASGWSKPSSWTMGLLQQEDWGDARWIDHPGRDPSEPLPIFAHQFDISKSKQLESAVLYISGIGLFHATINGHDVTQEVLAPGYSNLQLSTEYRTYEVSDLLESGRNAIGVALGNGPAFVRRSITNAAVGRTSPYSWWESQLKGNDTLKADVEAGSTSIVLENRTTYHVGGTVNIHVNDGGTQLESRVITALGSNTIDFTPGLSRSHKAGVRVTGSGNNIAASDASAGAAVTPRFIARLEIIYTDGSSDIVVTDRSWRAALGPLTTDSWYSGSDYDARREEPGWNLATAKLREPTWAVAGFAPPPNLATKLVARTAEVVKVQERFEPISVNSPAPGIWVFDFGQNIAGWPLLTLPRIDPDITIRIAPAESLNANDTVNQESLGPGGRGRDLFNTYTTSGRADGETWHPHFQYFGMQWVQVTGLPPDFQPDKTLITGLRLQADTPFAGSFESSDPRLNRLHKMCRFSIASNTMSVWTDCPGREKMSYPADYTMPMGAIRHNIHSRAYLHTTMRHLVEGQSIANTSMAGNVALKTPVFDWGYEGRFGDEINWGDAIVLVPALAYDLYHDTWLMETYYQQMTDFVGYIQREKVIDGYIVDAALADWVEDDSQTTGRITGTWGYYLTVRAMARMARITGRDRDAEQYGQLANAIRNAFNDAFFDEETGRYTTTGDSDGNATQAAQALALDSGIVADKHRESVLIALVELVYDYPKNIDGPHFSGGTISMGPIVRALSAGDRDDVIWEALQLNSPPSYGYFMASTNTNPNGFTTIGERWTRGSSKNHMILAQIEEWLHTGVAGIQPTAIEAITSTWKDGLVFQPKVIGNVKSARAKYMTRAGEASSEWELSSEGILTLTVKVPANTDAKVYLPGRGSSSTPSRARRVGQKGKYVVYEVLSGTYTFTSTL